MGRPAPPLAISQPCFAPPHGAWQTLVCGEARDSLCGLLASPGPLPWSAVFFLAIVGNALPCRLQLYANRVLRSSLVSGYYTLQPLAAALVIFIIVLLSPPPHLGVHAAGGTAALGGVILVVGLCLVLRSEGLTPLGVQPGGARGLLPAGTARSSDEPAGAEPHAVAAAAAACEIEACEIEAAAPS